MGIADQKGGCGEGSDASANEVCIGILRIARERGAVTSGSSGYLKVRHECWYVWYLLGL